VTIQCCRCHNHKFDPFTQEDYYSLQAVFAAVDRADRPFDTDPDVERRRREYDDRLKRLNAELAKLDETVKKEGGEELADARKQIKELLPKTTPKDKHPAYGYHSNIVSKPDTEKWVQVDLGRAVELSKVKLHPSHSTTRRQPPEVRWMTRPLRTSPILALYHTRSMPKGSQLDMSA
jgi:hypothetical protein